MIIEILPFKIELDNVLIASSCLWSLALYLSLNSFKEWIIEMLNRWFNFAERSLYLSEEEFEKTRPVRESQNAFYASLFSILPFFILGGICNWGVEISLGKSWSISMGILACIGCGVYELGRLDNQE
jgi:hypothetical protein